MSTDEDLSTLMEKLEVKMGDLGRARDEIRLVTKRSLPEAEILKPVRDAVRRIR